MTSRFVWKKEKKEIIQLAIFKVEVKPCRYIRTGETYPFQVRKTAAIPNSALLNSIVAIFYFPYGIEQLDVNVVECINSQNCSLLLYTGSNIPMLPPLFPYLPEQDSWREKKKFTKSELRESKNLKVRYRPLELPWSVVSAPSGSSSARSPSWDPSPTVTPFEIAKKSDCQKSTSVLLFVLWTCERKEQTYHSRETYKKLSHTRPPNDRRRPPQEELSTRPRRRFLLGRLLNSTSKDSEQERVSFPIAGSPIFTEWKNTANGGEISKKIRASIKNKQFGSKWRFAESECVATFQKGRITLVIWVTPWSGWGISPL